MSLYGASVLCREVVVHFAQSPRRPYSLLPRFLNYRSYCLPWQQPLLPAGQHFWQKHHQQQGAPGGPGVALQSPHVSYSGHGHATHGLAPHQPPPHQQQLHQHQPVFHPGMPGYGPPAGSPCPGGPVGRRRSAAPGGSGGPHAFNGGG